ncbi:hypothetical protein [Saccharibacillus kuerlensis]|uniref:Uncharacterized protein n=1 Tax=Saccharibacillus kuerlensis TaxID=459527 RepID=A0ABQ2L048_9BACL|nr:hypothetical protein [Saccharibacillus kuerlensis]GGN98187.1 hypothetical protein GCM10010969_16950 [Saccharibacillus kuerlensis]
MPMQNRVQELRNLLPSEHKGISAYVEHAFQSIDQLVEQHRCENAALAIYGDRINGNEERVYFDTVSQIKAELLKTLEKTVQDALHSGDKNWSKHYKDGIRG